jgi:8-amino-3,8-dideoxy-alpha-D-manno-octulosonate transaminase
MKRRELLLAAGLGPRALVAMQAAGASPVQRPRHWGPLYYDEAERVQLNDVLESRNPFRWYAAQSKVRQFEQEFAARMQTKHALAVTSGTAALQVALAALEIGPGDEVILPAWTWHSCFNTIVLAGALPVIAEIDETFNIDPDDIERHITPQTRAIMAVHLQGNPCRIDRVLEIARKHKLRVIEDCAQSVGGSFRGKPLGALGDVGIYSLQQNKTITAGEGGAVVMNDAGMFERAARFHDMGMVRPAHGTGSLEPFIGTNYRMNEFTGGVLLAQIRKIDRIIGDTRARAQRLYDGVRDLPGIEFRKLPDPKGDIGAAVFIGFANKDQREAFIAGMKAEGVVAQGPGGSVVLPLVPQIMKKKTLHPAWPSFNTPRGKAIHYGPETCPKTIAILNRFGGVPIDPKWTKEETDRVVAAMRKVYGAVRG